MHEFQSYQNAFGAIDLQK